MRNFIRSPLTWMVAAELAVVGALMVVGWNVVASANRPIVVPPVIQTAGPTDDPGPALPLVPASTRDAAHGPVPGLSLDPNFWRDRLGQLNGDQTYLEQLEWQIVHSAESAAQHYLVTVVLPALQHAEHAQVPVMA